MLVRDNIDGYTGLYGFHKYWGKKPSDVCRFLIHTLSRENDFVLDPFVGSGVLAIEAQAAGRQFLGIDINPVAVHISRLLVEPPPARALAELLTKGQRAIREKINRTYRLRENNGIATHYLWHGSTLRSVWTRKSGRSRIELEPTTHDYDVAAEFSHYQATRIRPIRLFDNSRINSKTSLTVSDLLTGRAQHNIDLILEWIESITDRDERNALRGCLTSAVGQMSKMVFAITGRGKTNGTCSTKIEVGSWVIGYWRPELHFEINVWNCFERRVKKLLRAIEACGSAINPRDGGLFSYGTNTHRAQIRLGDARAILPEIGQEIVDLIITDPPHGDRIPYLELSELWNAILSVDANFDGEIVVSNAKTRNKDAMTYQDGLEQVFTQCRRILKPGGYVVVLFNARDEASWIPVRRGLNGGGDDSLKYEGAFESHYSAGSVVQDNREGGLQYDYGLVFSKPGGSPKLRTARRNTLSSLPGWSSEWPF